MAFQSQMPLKPLVMCYAVKHKFKSDDNMRYLTKVGSTGDIIAMHVQPQWFAI